MDVTQIPFAKHVGIAYLEEGTLKLEPIQHVQNHIESIHASAQFTLAETQSGLFLHKLFPEYEGKVAGVLRSSTVKFRAPALTTVMAKATLNEDGKMKFITQLESKGRAIVSIDVSVIDTKGIVTMQGEFSWFVQKI